MTSFGEVVQYSKPQPSLMPNVDSVLREIGKWRYMVTTDLLKFFNQIPLANSSMKYCGVATPFKGIHVYTRSAVGMPGSKTCLEELMSLVLGTSSKRAVLPKSLTTYTLGQTAPLRSSTIGEEFLPYSKRTVFAYLRPKLSSAQERPSYWAGSGLMAPCKLAPTNWPHYPQSSLPQQCKASAPLSELTRF